MRKRPTISTRRAPRARSRRTASLRGDPGGHRDGLDLPPHHGGRVPVPARMPGRHGSSRPLLGNVGNRHDDLGRAALARRPAPCQPAIRAHALPTIRRPRNGRVVVDEPDDSLAAASRAPRGRSCARRARRRRSSTREASPSSSGRRRHSRPRPGRARRDPPTSTSAEDRVEDEHRRPGTRSTPLTTWTISPRDE